MFQSSQYLSFPQQTIALSRTYPCPKCASGIIETQGLSETFQCNECKRGYVALKGGHFLYPAQFNYWKIASTYWWDGFHWHKAGTTATNQQLSAMFLLGLLPVIALNLAIHFNLWASRPTWCHPLLLSPIIALATIQFIYLLSWDFDFHTSVKN